MKKYILFLLLSTFLSCKGKFNPNEFKGTWIPINDMGQYSNLAALTFKNDSVFLEDYCSYNIKASYHISKKSIDFFLKNDTLKYKLNFSRKDSTLQINNYNYMFLDGYSYNHKLVNYNLINLEINQSISSDSLFKGSNPAFHLFKDSNNNVQLKLNDKVSSDFSLIPRFVFGSHRENNSIIIYIGNNINLKELIKCYVELSKVNINNVFLLTHFNIKQNNYNGFSDSFEMWQSQINQLSKELIEPPLKTIENDRKLYFHKYSIEIILVKKYSEGSNILDRIQEKKHYLIRINSDLSIKNYILLKQKIANLKLNKKINIRTEFVNL